MENPLFFGDATGVSVWFKLCQSSEGCDVAYVKTANEIAQRTGKFYFTDLIEQRKKKLNNQDWFVANWNSERNQWVVECFVKI